MALTPSFRTFVLEQLGRVVNNVRGRSMFGGAGIYSGDLFFGLIADDTLYFKVDDSTRGDFESQGLAPFRPFGPEGEEMQYYSVPAELLEDAEALKEWAEKAVEVARRAKRRPARRGRR
jgi:DNA transformation protein and related proteins